VGALLDHRYLVTGLLARGGMSTVYRGMDTRLQRPVAIKVMHQQYAADRSWAQRFQREALATARLQHPNVVGVYDQGVDYRGDQAHAFLVMELVDGGTLRDLLDERGALPPALAVSITEQVLAGLAAAHRAGLVHRDVKPENVLLGHGAGHTEDPGQGSVKVVDFGLVRAIAGAGTTSSSVILGTVAYLSPEQVETGEASERSDVYSTGLLLYEMLTGKPAFSGDTALSVAYQHVNTDVPSPRAMNPEIPAVLDELVVRATRRDPRLRPKDAAEFLTELRRARAEAGLPVVPVPAVPPPNGGDPSADATVPAMNPVRVPSPKDTLLQSSVLRDARPPADTASSRPRRIAPLRVAWWSAVALLVAGLVAVGVWVFVQAGSTVQVPDLAGMTRDRATQALQTAELQAKFVEQRHNTIAAGLVIETRPAAGTEVQAGDTVTVLISAGKPVVPDIAEGASREEAEQAIKAVQLKPVHDEATDEFHPSVPEGAVIRVQPKPGTTLDIGDEVTLVLSKGPPPTPVPDVTGLPKEEAFQKLKDAGFHPVDGGTEFSADLDAGMVVRTEPAAGATPTDTTVKVVVSNAVPVPNLVAKPVKEARQLLGQLGLKLEVVQGRGKGRLSLIYAQEPRPGGRVEPGGTVRVKTIP